MHLNTRMRPGRRRSKGIEWDSSDPVECYRYLLYIDYTLNILVNCPPRDYDDVFFHHCLQLVGDKHKIRELIEKFKELVGPKRLKEAYPGHPRQVMNPNDYNFNLVRLGEMIQGLANEIHPSLLIQEIADLLVSERDVLASLDYSNVPIYLGVEKVKNLFNLSSAEATLVEFLWIINHWQEGHYFRESLDCLRYQNWRYLAAAVDMTLDEVSSILYGRLLKLNIIERAFHHGISLTEMTVSLLQSPTSDELNRFFKVAEPEDLPLEAHAIAPDVSSYALELLNRADKQKTSTHILLWGQPGTGKSSYARRLAHEIGAGACLIQHGSAKYSPHDSPAMVQSQAKISVVSSVEVAKCNNKAKKSLFIVDDADSLLGTRMMFFFSGEQRSRVWLHELLEEPGLKMIWVVNDASAIEDSVKRRFAFSIYFPPLNPEQKIILWGNVLRRYKAKRYVSDEMIGMFARRYDVSAGVIDQAVKKALEAGKPSKQTVPQRIEMALDAHKVLTIGEIPRKRDKPVKDSFLIEAVNSSIPLQTIVEDLQEFDAFLKTTAVAPEILNRSLLFSGHPGCGKTEFAKYLAEALNRPLLRKLGSDIFDMYVGNTEKNIRKAYQEAEATNSILFFDECDSLLQSRSGSEHSWERTQVNELLARMELFVGIQVFGTNEMGFLDSASVRRFSHKIHFGFLKPDGIEAFYQKFLAPMVEFPATEGDIKRVRNLQRIAPGDFKVVREQFYFKKAHQLSHRLLISALEEESKIKKTQAGEKDIGFKHSS